MSSAEALEHSLIEEISSILGVPVVADMNLLAEAHLDSFNIMQIIAFLEDEYRCEVPEELLVIDNFASVAMIVEWCAPLVGVAPPA